MSRMVSIEVVEMHMWRLRNRFRRLALGYSGKLPLRYLDVNSGGWGVFTTLIIPQLYIDTVQLSGHFDLPSRSLLSLVPVG